MYMLQPSQNTMNEIVTSAQLSSVWSSLLLLVESKGQREEGQGKHQPCHPP
jgi:hypothetical protein